MTGSSVSSLFANYADHAIAHAFWAATNRFEAFVSFVDEVGWVQHTRGIYTFCEMLWQVWAYITMVNVAELCRCWFDMCIAWFRDLIFE